MRRRLLSIPFLTTVLLCALFHAPDPVCGQSTKDGTIICCNQHVKVRGNWVGALHNASCEDYARMNAPARAQLCKMKCLSKEAKERYCGKEDCKEDPKPSGAMYAGVPGAKTRAQPGETAAAVGSVVYGQRLVYREVKKVNGTTWFKVVSPAHLAGWISGNDVFCELPPPPPPPPPDHSCKKNLKVPGILFVGSSKHLAGKTYSDSNADSKVIATSANGIRMPYREIRKHNGETWFYVVPPGRPPGWMRGSDLVCNRPEDSPPGKRLKALDSGLGVERPTAAIASAGRG